jgi:hypothetical protein
MIRAWRALALVVLLAAVVSAAAFAQTRREFDGAAAL